MPNASSEVALYCWVPHMLRSYCKFMKQEASVEHGVSRLSLPDASLHSDIGDDVPFLDVIGLQIPTSLSNLTNDKA